MNAEQLKNYIAENTERIEKVLESIECHRIWRSGDEVRCAPPSGNNHTAISVNMDTLFVSFYREGQAWRGDLIALVQLLRKETFSDSFRYLKSLFGLSGKFVKEEKYDPLALFKGIRKQSKIITDINEVEVKKFGREALSDFVMLPHIQLFYEGIMPATAELFNVGYDPIQSRIIFPHYNYDSLKDIVGITGRTTMSKEDIKEFLIPKYFNYIKNYKKMYNLYGFSHSAKYLEKSGMLIIFEAEKSVQKQFTQERNEGFSCSTGGHELSQIQVQIILQNTPLDTEVVIAYDKDVMTMKDDDGKEIGEEFLINTCNKMSKYRKTSYIWDTYNILGEKDAPIDKGYKVWQYLLKYRKGVS